MPNINRDIYYCTKYFHPEHRGVVARFKAMFNGRIHVSPQNEHAGDDKIQILHRQALVARHLFKSYVQTRTIYFPSRVTQNDRL